MDRINEFFQANANVMLVVVVSLEDRSVLLKVPRAASEVSAAPVLPPEEEVDVYLNLALQAAAVFGPGRADGMTNSGAWTDATFITPQWEIRVYRSNAQPAQGGTKAEGDVGTWLMVSFAKKVK